MHLCSCQVPMAVRENVWARDSSPSLRCIFFVLGDEGERAQRKATSASL